MALNEKKKKAKKLLINERVILQRIRGRKTRPGNKRARLLMKKKKKCLQRRKGDRPFSGAGGGAYLYTRRSVAGMESLKRAYAEKGGGIKLL